MSHYGARYLLLNPCIFLRPFDPDPRTGLVEGCAPLTKEDMGTILGCSTRFQVSTVNFILTLGHLINLSFHQLHLLPTFGGE